MLTNFIWFLKEKLCGGTSNILFIFSMRRLNFGFDTHVKSMYFRVTHSKLMPIYLNPVHIYSKNPDISTQGVFPIFVIYLIAVVEILQSSTI